MKHSRKRTRDGKRQVILAVLAVLAALAAIIFAVTMIVRSVRGTQTGWQVETAETGQTGAGEEDDWSTAHSRETMAEQLTETTAESEVAAEVAEMDDAEDPQNRDDMSDAGETGARVEFEETGNSQTEEAGAQNSQTSSGRSDGIDVSKYQGKIDWAQVKAAGIDFAMIRVGYRTQKTGVIFEDPYARYNLQEAQKAGVMLGAYFFSTAVTEEEAREEAVWVSQFISQYRITYPVAYNCEGFKQAENRQYSLTKETRTDLAEIFLDQISQAGYTPMFYAARNELTDSRDWDTARLESKYQIWVSQYPELPYPQTPQSSYAGTHQMWQYTSQGSVAGISGYVDIDVAYFTHKEEAQPKSTEPPAEVADTPELGHVFTEVSETVTAKILTNLRTEPSTASPDTVVHQLAHGETVLRTGIGDRGWSRVEYNGQTLYAVTSYLTTDLESDGPGTADGGTQAAGPDGADGGTQAAGPGVTDGESETAGPAGNGDSQQDNGPGTGTQERSPLDGVIFTEVNETVTAKIETNLRTEPSTRSDDTVVVKLINGETAVRTGIGSNGWSRVEYNGQTLYAVTSYLTAAE